MRMKSLIYAGVAVVIGAGIVAGWSQLAKKDPWVDCACKVADEKHFGKRSDRQRASQPISEGLFGTTETRADYDRKLTAFTKDQRVILGTEPGAIPAYVIDKCGPKPTQQ